jgi:ppGpp synthetase/RelA/SpoT-type nucleotidyltranferase
MTNDLEAIRGTYLAERSTYAGLAKHVLCTLEVDLQRRGLLCVCTAREKDMASLLKKALRKNCGYEDIHDKAGVRVVVNFVRDLPCVEDAIRRRFVVHHYENKILGLEFDRLGYLGIHFEVSLRPESPDTETALSRDLLCEIQVHTRAQNCWAELSHQLIYKSDQTLPPAIRRRVYRLLALIELFDESVDMAQDALLQIPDFEEGRLLNELERWFYRLTARGFDRDLSLQILRVLKNIYSNSERTSFGKLLDDFVSAHLDLLQEIYTRYRNDDRCSPLLFQPEALLIFERLTSDQFQLKEAWLQSLPETLLRDLASIWGVAI